MQMFYTLTVVKEKTKLCTTMLLINIFENQYCRNVNKYICIVYLYICKRMSINLINIKWKYVYPC